MERKNPNAGLARRLELPAVGAVLVGMLVVAYSSPHAFGVAQFVETDPVLSTISGTGGSFGWGVADLVDIDGDNVTDVISGAPGINRAYVYSGRTGNLIHTLIPSVASGRAGHAIADAGDTNNDGVHDIVVGANDAAGTGMAFVHSGVDGSILFSVAGEAVGDSFGFGVGGAGDVNSDGHDDIVVGAPGNDANGGGSGRAYIFSGVDGSLLRFLDAESAGDAFGNGIAGTGDLNGDLIGDQIVGAPTAGTGGFGKAYVFSGADGSLLFDTDAEAGASSYGTFFVAGVGDVNNDGNLDVYVGDFGASGGGKAYVYSGIDGTPLFVFPGTPGEGVGPGRGAGDVDGDGFADLLIGHWTSSIGAGGAGRTTIRSGFDGHVIRSMTSLTAGEAFGFDAVGIGDVNADGLIDFLVSAASQNRIYIMLGRLPLGDLDADWDVDEDDGSLFEACFTGLDAGPPAPQCAQGDFDFDNDIDCTDWDLFQQTFPFGATPPELVACTAAPALAAAAPHDRRKNRYISFEPNNPTEVAFKVELTCRTCSFTGKKCSDSASCRRCTGGGAGGNNGQACDFDFDCDGVCAVSGEFCNDENPAIALGWIDAPEVMEDGSLRSRISEVPVFRIWESETIHIGDSSIAPVRTYAVSVTADGGFFPNAWHTATILKPAGKFWADLAGSFDGSQWSVANGLVSVDDVLATIKFITLAVDDPGRPHMTWIDLGGQVPNWLVNATDLQLVLKGFQAETYPPISFPDPNDPPTCP